MTEVATPLEVLDGGGWVSRIPPGIVSRTGVLRARGSIPVLTTAPVGKGARAMREENWLGCTNPTPMLDFVRDRASDRKLRLFAVACCRRIWHLFKDEGSQRVVEVAERYADGLAGPQE